MIGSSPYLGQNAAGAVEAASAEGGAGGEGKGGDSAHSENG